MFHKNENIDEHNAVSRETVGLKLFYGCGIIQIKKG